jgi:hypothetical protein
MSNNPFLGLGFNSWAQKFSRVAQQIGTFLQYLTTPNTSSFTLRSTGTVNYRVDWGDGSVETLTTTSPTHTYSSPGQYTIKINPEEGSIYRPYFNDQVSNTSIAEVSFPGGSGTLGSTLSNAWNGASNMTSFGEVDTSSGTDFSSAWYGCSSLTSFPLIDTSSGTNFSSAWYGCSSLTSFPLIDTSSGTDFSSAWDGCSSLTSFPLIDTSSGTNFYAAWFDCSSLTSFPLIDTSSGTDFYAAWGFCSSLTSFPLIDTSSGTDFGSAWDGCSSLTSFPLIDTSSGTDFSSAWYDCSSLTTFPANMFDTTGTLLSYAFNSAWTKCALTAQSIENILTSLDINGASNITLHINIGTNASKSTWSTSANDAYDNLIAKGWTISYNL